MMNQGHGDDAKKDGFVGDDDPDGVGLTIPAPGMAKPWNPPKPKVPAKTPSGEETKNSDEPKEGEPVG